MKTVKMLVSMAGPDESWQPGDRRSVEDSVADEWEKLGIATPHPPDDIVVKEVVKEKAKKKAQKKRSKK